MTLTYQYDQASQGTYLQSESQSFLLDPKIFVKDLTAQTVIFTHLNNATIDYLTNPSEQIFYLSQPLFTLIQKAHTDGLLARSLTNNWKMMPTKYPFMLGEVQFQFFNNDDYYYGAGVLLFTQQDGPQFGYCDTFESKGLHKNRIKKWKKAFKAAELDVLLLGQSLKNQKPTMGFKPYLKELTAQLTKQIPLEIALSPFNPPMISEINQIAKNANRQLILSPKMARLLNHFDPWTVYYTTENINGAENLQVVSAKEITAHPENYLVQSALINLADAIQLTTPITVDGLTIMQNQGLSESQLVEFINYINAKETHILD